VIPAPVDDCPRFLAINMAAGTNLDEAGAVALAKSTALVSANPGQIDRWFPQMRSARPDGRWLGYLNATFGPDTKPAAWYGLDASGNRLHSQQYPANFVMLPFDPDWVADRVAEAGKLVSLGFDGVMLDMCGPYPTRPHYLDGILVDPRTKEPYTAAAWIADTAALAKAVKTALGSNVVLGNGLESGTMLEALNSATIDLLVPGGMDGGLAEQWMEELTAGGDWGAAEGLPELVAERSAAACCMVKPWKVTDPKLLDQIHRYSLATFHLGKTGLSFYGYTAANTPEAIITDSPYEHVAIGYPLGAAHANADGHWSRPFETGLALANPSSQTVVVHLRHHAHWWGGRALVWTDLDGQQVTDVTLAPQSGEVLTVS